METFFTFLARRIDDCSSPLCIEIDPRHGPPSLTAEELSTYCGNLIQQTARYAAAFKLSVTAFDETIGSDSKAILQQTIAGIQAMAARLGSMMPIILDLDGDVATSTENVLAILQDYRACAVLVPAASSHEILYTYLTNQEKGAFLRYATDCSGTDTPDLPSYEQTLQRVQSWNVRGNIGLAIDQVKPAGLEHLRGIAPDLWFLLSHDENLEIDLAATFKAGLRRDGKGLLITAGEQIAQSEKSALTAAELRDEMIYAMYN
jgi:orotidine-5'-phosphate decarboxylase